MRRDSIVLGNNYILPGSDVGKTRPNALDTGTGFSDNIHIIHISHSLHIALL